MGDLSPTHLAHPVMRCEATSIPAPEAERIFRGVDGTWMAELFSQSCFDDRNPVTTREHLGPFRSAWGIHIPYRVPILMGSVEELLGWSFPTI